MRIKLRNNSEVAHYWAHQKQATGEGSHFYFTGSVIYSYGSHFPVANIVNGTVLFTTRSYSNSTAKHKLLVRRACSHMPVIYVNQVIPNSGYDHELNMSGMRGRIVHLLESAKRAYKYKASYLEDAQKTEEEPDLNS